MEPPPKRRRLSHDGGADEVTGSLPRSLSAPISPPRRRRRASPVDLSDEIEEEVMALSSAAPAGKAMQAFRSPFQLTWIHDLPEAANTDAVKLQDLLGDPLIAECWDFNYLHDIDFLMEAFDEDVRALVNVHVVHGFWKREDESRLRLQVSRHGLASLLYLLAYTHSSRHRSKRARARTSAFTVLSCQRCLARITLKCWFFFDTTTLPRS